MLMLTGTVAGVDADLAGNSTTHRHPDAGVFSLMGASKLMLYLVL
jgi:hypothetical protein